MHKNTLIFLVFYLLITIPGFSQEYIKELEVNPVLYQSEYTPGENNTAGINTLKSARTGSDSYFFDDFSYPGPYPAPSKWLDNTVFINNSYSSTFISVGIVTFDALNSEGIIYEHLKTNESLRADSLISIETDLSSAENPQLSFFYLPGGLGNAPDKINGDSLALYFKSAQQEWTWIKSYHNEGQNDFTREKISIPKKYRENFQFKFVNYVSLISESGIPQKSSNSDLWHLDYILINTPVSTNDSSLYDVVFNRPMPSMFLNYESFPYRHWNFALSEEYVSDTVLSLFNYNTAGTGEDVRLQISYFTPFAPSYSWGYDKGSQNILSYSENKRPIRLRYEEKPPAENNETVIKYQAIISDISEEANREENDTITKEHFFGSYYAYDDGISEKGYGFKGNAVNGVRFICRFRNYVPGDSVYYLNYYFNPTKDSATLNTYFRMIIFDHDEETGKPGKEIYSESVPVNKEGWNQYMLNSPIPVDEVYYIGWEQLNNKYLNVGYDVNRTNKSNNFIYTSGTWMNSSAEKTVMIRPGFEKKTLTGTKSNEFTALNRSKLYTLYPNPAEDILKIRIKNQEIQSIRIYNMSGKTVYEKHHHHTMVNVSHFTKGMYFIQVSTKNNHIETQRFIITR